MREGTLTVYWACPRWESATRPSTFSTERLGGEDSRYLIFLLGSSTRRRDKESMGRGTYKPNSVCRRTGRTVIPLGRALLRGSSDLPGSCGAPSRHASASRSRRTPPLFGLAPCGVFPALAIARQAVR